MLNTFQPLSIKRLKIPHEDHKFIIGLKENNGSLIEEIYLRCSNNIAKMVISNKGDKEDAKDIFQETLISIYRQANTGFILTCPLEQFMYMACKRKWINKLKKRRLEYQGEFNDLIEFKGTKFQEDESTIVAAIQLEDRSELVRKHFKLLGPSCREIISLSWKKKDNGKYRSWKEISSELNLSYGYVRKKAVECKERLFTLVKKDPNYNRLK